MSSDSEPRNTRPLTLVVAIEIGKRGANLDSILQAIRNCEGVTDADQCAEYEHGETVREVQVNVMVASTQPLKKFMVRINRNTDYEVLAVDAEDAKDRALDGEGKEVDGETRSVKAFLDTDDWDADQCRAYAVAHDIALPAEPSANSEDDLDWASWLRAAREACAEGGVE